MSKLLNQFLLLGMFVTSVFTSSAVAMIPLGLESSVHPYHVSLAEFERNERSGNFEVSLCIWPADLEKALSQKNEKPIDLDEVENLDDLIAEYLKEKVVFADSEGNQAPIRFVGCELDLQKGWLYFEVQTGKERDDWSFQNRIFFELNEDQINHFNFKMPRKIQSDACTIDKTTVQLGGTEGN